MMLRKFNVCRKDETERGVFWRKVGVLLEMGSDDGPYFKLDLFMYPQQFSVFEDSEPARKERAKRKEKRHETGHQNP